MPLTAVHIFHLISNPSTVIQDFKKIDDHPEIIIFVQLLYYLLSLLCLLDLNEAMKKETIFRLFSQGPGAPITHTSIYDEYRLDFSAEVFPPLPLSYLYPTFHFYLVKPGGHE